MLQKACEVMAEISNPERYCLSDMKGEVGERRAGAAGGGGTEGGRVNTPGGGSKQEFSGCFCVLSRSGRAKHGKERKWSTADPL